MPTYHVDGMIGRQAMDCKPHSGATGFGEGSPTTFISLLFSLSILFSCTDFLLPTVRTSPRSTHPNYRIVVEVLLQLQRLLRCPLHRTSRQTRTSCGETNTMLKAGNLYTLFDMKEIRWIYCSKKTTEPVLLAS